MDVPPYDLHPRGNSVAGSLVRRGIIALVTLFVFAGCGAANDDTSAPPVVTPDPQQPTPTAPPTAAPITSPDERLGNLTVELREYAGAFEDPTGIVSAGDGSGRLFVLERRGQIHAITNGESGDTPFLDIQDRTLSEHLEQGLLGMAFHPAFRDNGRLFVYYINRDEESTLSEFRVDPETPDRVSPETERVLLTLEQPHHSHNGGQIAFGPDNYLYIGLGDGQDPGDPHEHAQDPEELFGSILRIDVDGGEPYAIPADNPFLGDDGAREEIWAIGLRNPWRFSFDPLTRDLYIADVGQWEFEEVNIQPAASTGGENYGWPIMHGDECFEAVDCERDGLTPPVTTYSIEDTPDCAVIGGYVYRGREFPEMDGIYFFGDWCSGRLRALTHHGNEWFQRDLDPLGIMISAFGVDEAGELYVADYHGGNIFRLVVQDQ